jgi:hypothetical protein
LTLGLGRAGGVMVSKALSAHPTGRKIKNTQKATKLLLITHSFKTTTEMPLTRNV